MDIDFMKTLDSFKSFMTSDLAPGYVQRYCHQLNDVKWIWFYAQMIEAMLITDEPEYLFYVLKWILKNNLHDLAYEMYCQDMMNPECRSESLIKDSLWDAYSSHYFPIFAVDFGSPE